MSGFRRPYVFALLLAAAGAAIGGCAQPGDGLPREPVSGTVKLDGQPLPSGTIQFTPVEESTAGGGGARIEDGRFSIPRESGLVPGNYRVAIFAAERGGPETKPASPGVRVKSAKPKETIPAKYNAQTELKAEIKKGGPNDLPPYDLQSK